ncbi:photosynthetic NDH subunit of subcomplex B 3, chloroplastic [Telopea speciosissima]|uniref:photosynthetic NDH subunit of subcomplex B 3, chloroplastic n=1 Tax=Telopea speciosissima TaxID=54955 RepID=UPI001CC41748|nr:photosynthetic NDH subunit of subcomplex B 3, chloroplastic [Telopea speciosissima]
MTAPALQLHFVSLSFKPRETSVVQPNYPKPISFPSLKKSISLSRARNPSESVAPSTSVPEKPEIELEFIGSKPGPDGSYPVERASAISGEKLLRNIMLDNKIELYGTYGKVMNCGGGGSCGTCIVEVIDGEDLLNERTNTELRYLKKKPQSWRLSCQTIVGNKENSGKVVIQSLPQWKK